MNKDNLITAGKIAVRVTAVVTGSLIGVSVGSALAMGTTAKVFVGFIVGSKCARLINDVGEIGFANAEIAERYRIPKV